MRQLKVLRKTDVAEQAAKHERALLVEINKYREVRCQQPLTSGVQNTTQFEVCVVSLAVHHPGSGADLGSHTIRDRAE